MRHSRLAQVAAFLLPLLLGDFALAQAQAPFENPKIKVVYNKPKTQELLPIYTQLQKYAVLEELKQFLTPLRLPSVLTIQADECGAKTRPYKHGGPVTICYELIADFENIIAQHTQGNADLQRTMNTGAIVEALLHEISYAIFDVYEIPVWGRMDDAADRMSAFIMLQFGEDIAAAMIEGTGNLFLWSNKTWSGKDFASPSSPEAQRFYNYVCIAYGFDQSLFQIVVANGTLPAERAPRCLGEYAQVRKAFNLRVMPFIDPDLLVKAKAHVW